MKHTNARMIVPIVNGFIFVMVLLWYTMRVVGVIAAFTVLAEIAISYTNVHERHIAIKMQCMKLYDKTARNKEINRK